MLSFFPQIKRLFLILFDEFLFWKVLSLKFNRKYTETNHAFIKFILFWAIDSTVTLPEGNKNKNQESANVSHYIVFQWTLAGKNLFTSQYLGLCKFCHCPKISWQAGYQHFIYLLICMGIHSLQDPYYCSLIFNWFYVSIENFSKSNVCASKLRGGYRKKKHNFMFRKFEDFWWKSLYRFWCNIYN